MRISDWTSDVCSSDLQRTERGRIEQIFELDARPEWQNDQALRDKSDGGRGVNDRTADAQRYEVAMGDGILCFDNQIAFYASVLEDAIDPASCPIAVHERYEGFAGAVRRFDIGEVRESVPGGQYTRANRQKAGPGGHPPPYWSP